MLLGMLFLAIGQHVLAGGGGGQFGWGAVFVGGADVEHLMAPRALEAGVDVGGQHGAGEVAEMLDAVDVRQGGGDEDTGHGGPFSVWGVSNASVIMERGVDHRRRRGANLGSG